MKKRILMILAFLLVGVFAHDVRATTYGDGQSHDIDYLLNEGVIIYNHSHNIDEPTTVNLLSGGTVDGVDVYDSSFFNLFDGGTVNYNLNAHNDSRVNISGGTVSDLTAGEYSQVSMSGGQVDYFGAVGNSVVDVTGGSMKSLHVSEDSAVNISNTYIEYGGNLKLWQNASLSMTNTTFGQTMIDCDGVMDTYDNSHFTVGAGTVFNYIYSYDSSTVTISGGLVVDNVTAQNASKVEISSGSTVDSLDAWDSSEVAMTGGHVNRLDGYEDSTVDVTGGSIGLLRVEDDSAVDVSNAHIGDIWYRLRQNSSLSLTNTTFGQLHGPNMNTYDNSHLTLGTGTSFGSIRSYNSSEVTISGGSAEWVDTWDTSHIEMSGGTVKEIYAHNDSRVNISRGTVSDLVGAADYSRVVMTDGQAYYLGADDYGQITMSGGTVSRIEVWGASQLEISDGTADMVHARDDSHVIMSDGEVHYFDVGGDSTADITGGSIWDLVAGENGVANLSGGKLNTITVYNTGRITIEGTGFNYNYGYIQDTAGVLTGMLSNGDMISVSFYRDIDASILLIPVPEHSPIACIADVNQPIEAQGPFGAKVTLDGSCSSDADSAPGTNDDINDFNWYEIDPCDPDNEVYLGSGQIYDCNLPLGTHTVILEVIDKAGATDSNEITVTIEDTTPPEFNLSVSPTILWPANNKMVKITPAWTATDLCDPSPEVSLVDITMNEPGSPADIRITPDGSIYLCATRSGSSKGRIYTITYEACDESDNCTTKTAAVTVPHDNRK